MIPKVNVQDNNYTIRRKQENHPEQQGNGNNPFKKGGGHTSKDSNGYSSMIMPNNLLLDLLFSFEELDHMVKSLNDHPFYKSKGLIFHLADDVKSHSPKTKFKLGEFLITLEESAGHKLIQKIHGDHFYNLFLKVAHDTSHSFIGELLDISF